MNINEENDVVVTIHNSIRTDLELWLIVEENFNRIYDSFKDNKGLCNVLNQLCIRENKIFWAELVWLKKVIQNYKKSRNIDFCQIYFWDKDAKKPRQMFIQKQILKAINKK